MVFAACEIDARLAYLFVARTAARAGLRCDPPSVGASSAAASAMPSDGVSAVVMSPLRLSASSRILRPRLELVLHVAPDFDPAPAEGQVAASGGSPTTISLVLDPAEAACLEARGHVPRTLVVYRPPGEDATTKRTFTPAGEGGWWAIGPTVQSSNASPSTTAAATAPVTGTAAAPTTSISIPMANEFTPWQLRHLLEIVSLGQPLPATLS